MKPVKFVCGYWAATLIPRVLCMVSAKRMCLICTPVLGMASSAAVYPMVLGITSKNGNGDGLGVDFKEEAKGNEWRWTEQWLPHAA
jgi:hypothetical protein